jgi:hypothetical protein
MTFDVEVGNDVAISDFLMLLKGMCDGYGKIPVWIVYYKFRKLGIGRMEVMDAIRKLHRDGKVLIHESSISVV